MSDESKEGECTDEESIGTFRGGSRLGGSSSEKRYTEEIRCPVCGGTYYSME